MGNCMAGTDTGTGGGGRKKKTLIANIDGDENDYHARYLEDKVLGEGQFGVVKLVHDMKAGRDKVGSLGDDNDDHDDDDDEPPLCASKLLRKGVVFKDNTLYAPLKPEILQGECDILRTLAGKHYCLELKGIYESRSFIWMVTELCSGGEMMEYVASQEELRTEDISRIAYQLLSAVAHCAEHEILHRDIKPENAMFTTAAPGADLKLIDFGSGCHDAVRRQKAAAAAAAAAASGKEPAPVEEAAAAATTTTTTSGEAQLHTTFAGTAFYISPEMFQKKYTQLTDVWSVGVVLYVLVAGYPSDCLQKAFNVLQKSTRDIRKDLPHMPDDVPDSYITLLQDYLLVYRYKKRKTAQWCLDNSEFVQYHRQLEEEGLDVADVVAAAAAAATTSPMKQPTLLRQQSVNFESSVQRHGMFMEYQHYEHNVTTLLATLLSPKELDELIDKLDQRADAEEAAQGDHSSNKKNLNVIPVQELKRIVQEEMTKDFIVEKMNGLKNSEIYTTFSYHYDLLRDFQQVHPHKRAPIPSNNNNNNTSSSVKDPLHAPPKRRRSLQRTSSIVSSKTHTIASVHGNTVFRSTVGSGMNGSHHSLSLRGGMSTLKGGGKSVSSSNLPGSWHGDGERTSRALYRATSS